MTIGLALFQPDIPQNCGTSLRTAACLDVPVEIIEPCGFPFNERKFRRASMDYIDHVTYKRHNSWENFVQWAILNKQRVILLSSKAKVSYTEFSYKKGDVLLLGRETNGVPREVTDFCQENAVTIPMQKTVRSLNVAVAGAMVLGEAIRQVQLQFQ